MNITLQTVSRDVGNDSLLVEFTVDSEPYMTAIGARALASRRELYGLSSYEDAFVAIFREHWHRIAGDAPTSGTPAEMAAGMNTTNVDLTIDQAILDQVARFADSELAYALSVAKPA